MLGFGLEKRLRKEGRAAPATILEIDKGRSIHWTDKNQYGESIDDGTVAKDMYRLRVEPPGEPSFEAHVKIPDDKFFGIHAVKVGSTIVVLYDPNDHEKTLADVDATKAQQKGRIKSIKIDFASLARATAEGGGSLDLAALARAGQTPDVADELGKLADLRDRGALTEEEFAAQKAKLLG